MKPINFNGEMVRAILDGRKTQTRRRIRFAKANSVNDIFDVISCYRSIVGYWNFSFRNRPKIGMSLESPCQVGDVIWVRESVRLIEKGMTHVKLRYESDGAKLECVWPQRLKPLSVGQCVANGCYREAARIFLRVTNVDVQEVQKITEIDAIKEGIYSNSFNSGVGGHMHHDTSYAAFPERGGGFRTAKEAFECLWDSIYKNWDDNPWVWVYEFEIDEVKE